MIHTLDLTFLDTPETIAAFLIETSAGPVLAECGPYSVFPMLRKALAQYGYVPADIKALLLTHIHFDHAGAAWAFAAEGVPVYVHPSGYKHLHDPARLYASAARIYGDKMDYLWGKMEGIPSELLQSVADGTVLTVGDTSFTALHTPGHAVHHIAWRVGNNAIITGDVAGVKIDKGLVVPPCPPPDIDLEAWENSIDLLQKDSAQTLYLTHFGRIEDKEKHLFELRAILRDWAMYIKPFYEAGTEVEEVIPQFAAYTAQQLKNAGADADLIKKYEYANPAWMSVAGLMRYWKQRQNN